MKMNVIKIAAVTGLLLLAGQQGNSQETFVNLDFESVIPFPPLDENGRVPITNALPGWTGSINGNGVDRVYYDNVPLSGGPFITLVDSLTPFFKPIEGSYSVFLKSGTATGFIPAAIGQTGQIPSAALSLLFLMADPYLGVSFAGRPIPLVQFGTSGNYTVVGGDISMFAGQTGELLFIGTGFFDDIQFSNRPIPEPSTFCLFGLGALLLGLRFRCKRT